MVKIGPLLPTLVLGGDICFIIGIKINRHYLLNALMTLH